MEGGIGILLLVVIVLVAGGIGIALYVTGGSLWAGKTAKGGDKVEGGANADHRPEHKEPTSPTLENTEVVGAQEARERD
jgi:flagellar basal body-associated protein FliL